MDNPCTALALYTLFDTPTAYLRPTWRMYATRQTAAQQHIRRGPAPRSGATHPAGTSPAGAAANRGLMFCQVIAAQRIASPPFLIPITTALGLYPRQLGTRRTMSTACRYAPAGTDSQNWSARRATLARPQLLPPHSVTYRLSLIVHRFPQLLPFRSPPNPISTDSRRSAFLFFLRVLAALCGHSSPSASIRVHRRLTAFSVSSVACMFQELGN